MPAPASSSATFWLFHRAILNRQQVICRYKGQLRQVCPHILGHKDGKESVLVYQFAGESSRGLRAKGDWRCLYLAEVQDAVTQDGQWHSAGGHSQRQQCVDDVYVDVNTNVPNQPGRR